jgi:glycosyltransferase involved in cell wall biosynthesis
MHVAILGYGSSFWDRFPGPSSGREVQVWGIAKELARRKHEVTLVKAGESDGMIAADGVDIFSLENGPVKFSFRDADDSSLIGEGISFSRKTSGLLDKLGPDVLCLHYGLSGLYPAGLSIPYSFTFHVADTMFSARRELLHRDFAHYPRAMCSALMERRSAERASRWLVLNEHMAQYTRRVLGRPSQVVPCGVDETAFHNLGDDGGVLYVGRLDRNKNVEHLVRAYAALPPDLRREHRLKLLGSGSQESSIRYLVRSMGLEEQVDMIPWTGRVGTASIMGLCSVLVLPSYVETFGIVLIEAMACGKPIVASDIPGPRSIIRPGENGFLTRPESVSDLSGKLEQLLRDRGLRKRMGDRGRSDVEAKYTFRSIGGTYESVLKDLVGEAAGSEPLAAVTSFEAAPIR